MLLLSINEEMVETNFSKNLDILKSNLVIVEKSLFLGSLYYYNHLENQIKR